MNGTGRLSTRNTWCSNHTFGLGLLISVSHILACRCKGLTGNEMVQRDTPEGGTDNALFQPYKLGRFELDHRCTPNPLNIKAAITML